MNPLTLPSSPDIERALLSSFMLDAGALKHVDALSGSMFTDPRHTAIFETVQRMVERGAPVDVVTIKEEMQNAGMLDRAGGTPYLSEVAGAASMADAGYLMDTLQKIAVRRELIAKCYRLAVDLSEESMPEDLLQNTLQGFSEIVEGAWGVNRGRGTVVTVNSLKEAIERHYRDGFQNSGVNPGWERLGHFYRPAKKTLTTVTGIPSHGKSEFSDALMVNLAEIHCWTWAVYSPENYPFEFHIQKLAEKRIGKNLWHGMTKMELEQATDWIDKHFVFLEPAENKRTLPAILGLVEKAMASRHIDGIILDPWNEIEPTPFDNESETAFIGRSLSKCRRFARKNDVAFFIVAHPTKMQKERDLKRYLVPTLYDICGSANWNNKSDAGLCVYRDFEKEMVEIHVQKVRFKSQGRPGMVEFKYDRLNGRFTEIDETEGWN